MTALSAASIAPARERAPPIRVGDVFGRSRDLFAKHWAPYCTIVALGYAPLSVLTALADAGDGEATVSSEPSGALYASLLIGFSLFGAAFMCLLLSNAGINFAVTQEMRGRGFALGQSLTTTLRRAPAIVATLMLAWLCTLIGATLLVVPGIFVFCLCSVAIPACLAERLGPIRSLSRSAFLTKGNRWSVFGILCVLEVGGAALGELAKSASAMIVGEAWSSIARLPVDAIVGAFAAVAIGVLYVQLRVAREGVEIEHIAGVFD